MNPDLLQVRRAYLFPKVLVWVPQAALRHGANEALDNHKFAQPGKQSAFGIEKCRRRT